MRHVGICRKAGDERDEVLYGQLCNREWMNVAGHVHACGGVVSRNTRKMAARGAYLDALCSALHLFPRRFDTGWHRPLWKHNWAAHYPTHCRQPAAGPYPVSHRERQTIGYGLSIPSSSCQGPLGHSWLGSCFLRRNWRKESIPPPVGIVPLIGGFLCRAVLAAYGSCSGAAAGTCQPGCWCGVL